MYNNNNNNNNCHKNSNNDVALARENIVRVRGYDKSLIQGFRVVTGAKMKIDTYHLYSRDF